MAFALEGSRTRRGRRRSLLPAALLVAVAGCSLSEPVEQTVHLMDRHRYAHVTSDGQSVVFYRHDERPGATPGIYRVDVATGEVQPVVGAVMVGLDLHPQNDSIVYSAYAPNEVEPALWIVGLDGGGRRRLGGGGAAPGYRWPAFSPDGTRLSWEQQRTGDTGLDTASTLWIADWQDGAIANPRVIAPGRRSAWRPDGAALAVERRRPAGIEPLAIVLMDATGQVLDTLAFGSEPVWRPDGGKLAYVAEVVPDQGCLGVCFLVPGGSPEPLSSAFMSYTGSWFPGGEEFVYTRRMRLYDVPGQPPLRIEESRLWIRTLATGADRQLTF